MFAMMFAGYREHKARKEAMDRINRVSGEFSLYDIPPQVCITHMQHIPCRGGTEFRCVFSEDPEDVRLVWNFSARECIL